MAKKTYDVSQVPILGEESINPISGLTGPVDVSQVPILDPTEPTYSRYEPLQHVGQLVGKRSKYDTNLTLADMENLERERALKQPGSAKAFNAVVGGVASGVLTAIEDVGYILDFENNINRLTGVENVESNWLSDLMKQGKEGIAEGMPIHRMSQDVFDWDDPGFYWSAFKGILDSAVGFAIPGAAATKVIGAGQKALRSLKYVKLLKNSVQGQKAINAGLSGYITNFGEGKMMALELFENSMEKMKQHLIQDNYERLVNADKDGAVPPEQLYQRAVREANEQLAAGEQQRFEGIAGEQANRFMNRNKLFALTDAVGLHGLYKGKGFTRDLLSKKGLRAGAKRLGTLSGDNLLIQAGKEGLEEIGQNVLQMEGEYQTMKEATGVSESPEELSKRVWEFATSDQALLEGMMGLFGGGPQRILTEGVSGNFGKASKDAYRKRYSEQQAQIAANKEFLNTKLGNYAQSQKLRAEALTQGLDNLDEVLKNTGFVNLATENFVRGTTAQLETSLKEVINGVDEETRVANGWDEDYQQQATDQLAELKRMERSFIRYTKYADQGKIFKNRETRRNFANERASIKDKLDEVTSDIELAEIPNPEDVNAQKYYQTVYDQLGEKIAEEDKMFKKLTSHEYQKGRIAQDKANIKDIEEQDKKDRQNEKADAAKKRKDRRNKRTETKEKIEQDITPDDPGEVDIGPFADTEGTFMPTVEPDETADDVGIMPDDEIDDGADLTAQQVQAQESFNNDADGLIDDLTRELGDISGALVAGEGEQSKEQERVGRIQNMIEALKVQLGSEDIAFDDLMDALLQRATAKNLENIFPIIERLYSLTNRDHQVSNQTLAEYLQISPEERKARRNDQNVKRANQGDNYTDEKDKEVDDDLTTIENDMRGINNQRDPKNRNRLTFDYLRVESGSGILAYLSRIYDQVFKKGNVFSKQETTDKLNEDMLTLDLLDRAKFGKGTKVTLKVEEADSTYGYEDGDNMKNKTKWGLKKNAWKNDPDLTDEQRQQKYLEQVPIAVYSGDQKIGYLHETTWINETNVSGDVERDQQENREIRKHILENGGTYDTTISNKTTGYLFKSTEGLQTTSKAMPDTDLPIVIGAQGKLQKSRNKPFKGNLLNKKAPKEGVAHIVVPITTTDSLAIPLKNKKLGEDGGAAAESIMKALEIFYGELDDDASKAIVDSIIAATETKDKAGINISTAEGLTDYIELFVNNYDIGDFATLDAFLSRGGNTESTTDVYIRMAERTKRPGQNDVYFEISFGASARHFYLSKETLKKASEEKRKEIHTGIKNLLSKMYGHANLDHIGQNKKIPLVSRDGKVNSMSYEQYIKTMTSVPFLAQNIGTEENRNWVYTIQPVISMDFSGILRKKGEKRVKAQKEAEREVADITEPAAEPAPEEQKMFDDEGNYIEPAPPPPSTVKKRRPRTGGLNLKGKDDPTSAASVPMTEKQRKNMEELSEVIIDPETNDLTGVIISELGVDRQTSIVSYVRGKALEKIFKKKGKIKVDQLYSGLKKELIESDLEAARADHADAIAEGELAEVETLKGEIQQYEMYLKHWDSIVALTIDQLSRIGSVKVITKVITTDKNLAEKDAVKVITEEEIQKEDEGVTEEQEETQKENANWSDVSAFITNPADGIAPKVKQFLSGITETELNEQGEPIPVVDPFLGAPKIMDFQEVYDLVQRLTPNIRPNYNDMMAALQQHTTSFPFLNEVITRLDGADQQIKNQFVSGLTNHYVNMRFIMFSRNSETGAYNLVEHESDANALARVIQNNWYRNLLQSDDTGYAAEDPTEYVILPEAKERLRAIYKKWTDNKIYPPEEIREYLEAFGIVLHDETFNDLMKGEFMHNGRKQSVSEMINFKGGLVSVLNKVVSGPGAIPIVSGKVLDESVIRSLALEDSKNNLFSHTNSHRTGSKTVYSYGQNKFVVNRLREITDFTDDRNHIVDQLMNMPFSGTSEWLRLLQDREEGGEDNAFEKNLGYWVASLEPLKKKGSKSRNNAEMHNLSDAEIEVIKIGMLQSFYKDMSGQKKRVIQILYPTTSDKTTVMGLKVLATELKLTREGEMTNESLQKIVDLVIEPEIQRIRTYQEQKKKNTKKKRYTIDNKEYADGSEQFLFFPSLNNVPGMFLTNGDINPNFDTEEMQTLLREEAQKYVSSLVNEKLVEWKENEIGGDNERFLDHEFMTGGGNANPLKGVDRKGDLRVKAAATDMVFQYLIGNAEIAKIFTGDPAMYFKTAEVNKDASGNRKSKFNSDGSINGDYDFVADAEETYINIGKRLAADIAPGYEIAEEGDGDNFYNQAFIADRPSASHNKLQITKLLDGQEGYELAQKQLQRLEDKEIKERQFFNSIRKLKSAGYYAIDAADAQEYTTWQEHLYVMRQAGEISDDDYDKAFAAFSTGKALDKKVLSSVMQPMKPVYVDNVIDTGSGFERRVYIKSSAFPLIPELTQGTDLDNLRLAMEREGIDRVAFSTAVKVGNVTKPFDIFNKDGNIMASKDITFENSSLSLHRKGFRIQQKVPYDAEKFSISKVTQASKNLFINMLGVEGFKVPWVNNGEPVTGKRLQEEYHKIYDRLHQIEKEKLMDEIWDKEKDGLDMGLLRALLLTEAKKRNYPISDQELLVIDEELSFLAFSPSANKYEALLNSIVANRIIKLKFPGKSYVLGSEEGFQTQLAPDEAAEKIKGAEGIVYTDNWTGELLPAREGKGKKMLPAQAIVPWKFRDKEGNILKMNDFTKKVDGKTMIDFSKVPREVLEMFGMRIPNQGPNSQSWIEIVGFLPEASGDLFIATKDYVVQMGSDFDVDKIYTYMYNTYQDDAGTLKIHRDETETIDNEQKALQNKILDVHIAIHKNPDPIVQSQIVTPIGFWKLKDIASDVVSLRKERSDIEDTPVSNITYQGGFENKGKGTSEGDGKDKAMRGVANAFIGEVSKAGQKSSTYTSATEISAKWDVEPTSIPDEGRDIVMSSTPALQNVSNMVVMLARNGKLKGQPLSVQTTNLIDQAFRAGATFVVGDMPNVDSQFMSYLQHIGANFTVFHTGDQSRLEPIPVIREKLFTGLSDKYQRDKFKNAASGKSGVGVFSQDSMFNAVAQGKSLNYVTRNEEGDTVPISVIFGEKISNGDLSRDVALDEETYISDIIAGYQSGAVDNEKEQILDKLNINRNTFSVIKILNQLGFGEEVPYFLAQDIIIDYVKILERLKSATSDFYGNAETEALRQVREMDKYKIDADEMERVDPDNELSAEQATIENLKAYIQKGEKAPNYKYAQSQLLSKFMTLDIYGKEIQKAQSAINPDSAGLGKSVMESQMKEDQIFNLLKSPIRNVSRMIGDFRQIPKNKRSQYEEDGYVTRVYNKKLYAIKPETVNGFAIVHGLFTNNDLWKRFFPYEDESIRSLIDKVENLSTDSADVQVAMRADRRLAIWREIKSFVFSDNSLGLHNTTIAEERERLLYDKFTTTSKVENGREVTYRSPVENQESLATAIGRFKETEVGRNNALLKLLEINYQKNGDPSTIEYRASTAERADETNIYVAFTNAFQEEDQIIGTFKGKDYSLRELAQDLVLYSYITGGVQEAVQFVKYIPASYLTTMPFANALSNMSFVAADMNPAALQDKKNEFYNISPFVEQYFQHNPDKVPSFDPKADIDGGINSKTKSFKVNDAGMNKLGVTVGKRTYLPPYVSMRSTVSTKNARLFKYDFNNDIYIEIDTLGALGASEYDKNNFKYQRTLIRRNKVDNQEIRKPTGSTPEQAPVESIEDMTEDTGEPDFDLNLLNEIGDEISPSPAHNSLINNILVGTQKDETFTNGIEESRSMLNSMIQTSTNGYHKVLAEEILNNMDGFPSTMSLATRKGESRNAATYRYTQGQVGTDDVAHRVTLFTDILKGMSESEVNSTFLHELLHGLTGYKLLYYVYESDKTPEGKRKRELLEADPNFKYTSKDRKAARSIHILMNQARAAVLADPVQKAEYDKFIDNMKSDENVSPDQITKFYGFTDIKEFVTVALTNPTFQEMLNNIQAPSKKTFWEVLKERLVRLLDAIGFTVKKDSVLEYTIYNVLDLVTDRKESLVEYYGENKIKVVETYVETATGEPGAAQYDKKENVIRINNKVIQEKYNDKAWLTPRRQVDGSYATALADDKFSTIDHWRDFLMEHEYQHTLVLREEDETTGQYEDRVNEAAFKELDRREELGLERIVTEEAELVSAQVDFSQFGTYYKFDLDENGIPIRGFYSQGTSNNWNQMNPKKVFKKFTELQEEREGAEKVNSETVNPDNQLQLTDGKIITFSEEQFDALNDIRSWLDDRESQYFTLSGYAGTGKTTIIRKIIEEYGGRIAVSAPTHKATNKIGDVTDTDSHTLASLIGLRPNVQLDNFDPNNPIFKPIAEPKIRDFSMVVIDEASMINEDLLEYIRQNIGPRTKIVFMGDEAQIPPIGEKRSGVFKDLKKGTSYQLTQTQRLTDGNPLGIIYDAIRNNLDKTDGGFERNTLLNSKGEGAIFTDNGKFFTKQVHETFASDEYKDDPDHVKVIAWTNDAVNGANQSIRKYLYGENPAPLEKGEMLMGYNSIGGGKRGGMRVQNSVEYKITNVEDIDTNHNGIRGRKINVEYKNQSGDIISTNMFIVDTSDQENVDNYIRIHNSLESKAIGNKFRWGEYYAFRGSNLLPVAIPRKGKRDIVKDIDYAYAITAHKSQGSTYKHVYVLENDIDRNRNIKERNQIKYVAMSRASHTATVYTTRKVEQKNSYVDGALVVAPTTTDDISALKGVDFNDLANNILDVVEPQMFVSDDRLDEFMKRCKGL